MKKVIFIFLLPLLTFTWKVVGQEIPTYTIEVAYRVPTQKFCYTGDYGWLLSGDGNSIGGIVKNKIHLVTETDDFLTIPNYKNFDFSIFATCYDKNGNAISCSDQYIGKLTAIGLIMNGNFSLERCGESVEIVSFKPNVIIANSKSSDDICAGEELILEAFPGLELNKFPDEAYHWQYSIDNLATWIDVPISKSNTPKTSFSINEIFSGAKFDQQFYFRLGYGQDRPFSNVIPISYSPCGPVITDISFVGPQCNGDTVKSLAVTFEKKLDSSIGEKLASISVCDINDNSKIFMQVNGPISYSDVSKTYTYTIADLRQLETSKNYKIRYQAQITDPKNSWKTIMRGVLDSPVILNFPYTDPEKFNFTTTPTSALCHGGNGAIEILAWGGSSPYKYQFDNGTETLFKNPETIVEGTISKQKIMIEAGSVPNPNPNISTNHSIIVTDNKGCIDKTANE